MYSRYIIKTVKRREDTFYLEFRKIPLNRLKDLPENIVDDIEPIFFPEKQWEKQGNLIIIFNNEPNNNNLIELSEEEVFAFKFFEKNVKIREVAILLENYFNVSYKEARNICTSLFFKLALFRICHPKEIYNID